MRILSIDPGTTESGVVVYEAGRVISACVAPNAEVLGMIRQSPANVLAIEMVASYGMAVGKEVFETVRWIGRFQQAWRDPEAVQLVYRIEVKSHLCHSAKAKDGNIRQALIDRFGPAGTKRSPGPTYGVSKHAWAALAVAVLVADRYEAEDIAA